MHSSVLYSGTPIPFGSTPLQSSSIGPAGTVILRPSNHSFTTAVLLIQCMLTMLFLVVLLMVFLLVLLSSFKYSFCASCVFVSLVLSC